MARNEDGHAPFPQARPTLAPAPTGPPPVTSTVSCPPGPFPEDTPAENKPHDDVPRPQPTAHRYRVGAAVGEGGMGLIVRVHDPDLQREVVRKQMKPGASERQHHRRERRFLAEARITAQLQHPGVVPVHEVGRTATGDLYYTMREVHGTTLAQVISAVHWGIGSTWTMRRAIDVLRRVCETMAYAHSRGVVHRDLKPPNVMVGDFGEVQVLDWGLAKLRDAPDELGSDKDQSDAIVGISDSHTRSGSVLGSPPYMPPEQAAGELDKVDALSDVYALGAMLYELLCGEPPHRGSTRQILVRVRSGPPRDVVLVGEQDGIVVPPELAAICRAAMARDRQHRTPRARTLANQLSDWLEGVQRRDRALALVHEAEALWPEVSAQRSEAEALFSQAKNHLLQLDVSADVEARKQAWRVEDRAQALARSASLTAIEVEQRLRTALTHAPDLDEIHQRLADLYQSHMAEAEARRDTASAARHEVLLRAHDRGRHRDWLQGNGAVSLLTTPRQATVRWYRIVEVDRRLVAVFERVLGTTPLVEVALPRGSHLLEIEAAGHATVRYPVFIGRQEHWSGVGPDASVPTPIVLPHAEDLGPHDCVVPAGWFWSGGDAQAIDPARRHRVWVDGVIIRRHPVTMGEYTQFLNAIAQRGQDPAPWLPREVVGEQAGAPLLVWDGHAHVPSKDAERRGLGPHHPIVLVDHAAASAWCAWHTQTTGLPWRLPHDQEWEKAARGVDARAFPWGDHFDRAWACVATSHRGKGGVVDVSAFPDDVSIYGLRGCAGNVADWCENSYTRDPTGPQVHIGEVRGPHQFARGGLWHSSPNAARCATRLGNLRTDRRPGIGFRAARSFPAT